MKRSIHAEPGRVYFKPESAAAVLNGAKPEKIVRINDFEFDSHHIVHQESLVGIEILAGTQIIKLKVKKFNNPAVTTLILPLDSIYYIELKG